MADKLEADVVIVGAGVAGCLVAYRLAQAGAKVVVLESGPWVDRAQAVEAFRNAVAKVPEAPYPNLDYAPRPTVTSLKDGYYVQDGDDLFGSTYERRVGGSTWHWQSTAMRFLPNDFKIKTLYGVGVDWPLAYEQLEPWYMQAENELGVACDNSVDHGSPRSGSYPLPVVPQTYLDKAVAAALQSFSIPVPPTPQARNTAPFQNRPPCCGNNTCVPICPIGAKYDGSVHAALARDAGAQIVDQAVAYKVEVDSGGKVATVRFKRPDNSDNEAAGKLFVIAAHAIETPKLLLNSRSDALPNGVANSSNQVGRNLMDHPTQVSLCLASDPVYPYRGPTETSGIEVKRDGEHRKQWAAFRQPIGNDGWSFGGDLPITLADKLIADGKRGQELRDDLREQSIRQVRLAGLIEQLPNPDNRVQLADQVDKLGIPRPRLTYKLDDYTKQGLAEARKMADLVFDGLGATYRTHVGSVFGAGHILGTYRMGTDPKTSVVDVNQRSHDHPNLFLLGSGVFPTSGTANPTLTLCALALWAADVMKKDLGR